MAGIYIHIPFCKTRCIYCDFYSTTQSEWKERYIEALCKELQMRKEYLQGEPIQTIYWGGGTPSQLTESHFKKVFDTLEACYGMDRCEEITLEANPDDLTEEYVTLLHRLPFNRLSIGIQTFDDAMLRFLNRRHTAIQAIRAVQSCRKAGFENISIDLIYGLPGETEEQWLSDLKQALDLNVEHISAYHLTYEAGTSLHKKLQAHVIYEVTEECSLRLFTLLRDTLSAAGYEQYEISNFAREGKYARHNTSYWQGVPYLGCGPSAHSYNCFSREWNLPPLEAYLTHIEKGKRLFEREVCDPVTRYNECVMTSLRTRWGLDLKKIAREFGKEMQHYCLKMAARYLEQKLLEFNKEHLRLTCEGIFISDRIISDLMYVNE